MARKTVDNNNKFCLV